MKYFNFIFALAAGFLGPPVFLNLFIYAGWISTEPSSETARFMSNYFLAGYMYFLLFSIPFGIAGLFSKAVIFRNAAVWFPAYGTCLYALIVLTLAV